MSPALTLRSDLDAFQRGCSVLENFAVSATGGIRRRRGFRKVADAYEEESKLVPFVYSQDVTYVVELAPERLRVFDTKTHAVVAHFEGLHKYGSLSQVTWLQLNALLLLASPDWPLMVLRLDDNYAFTFERYEYTTPPWETVDLRDTPVTLHPLGRGTFRVEGAGTLKTGDMLRVSRYTDRQEASAAAAELLDTETPTLLVEPEYSEEPLKAGANLYIPGRVIAVRGKPQREYYVCVRASGDWTGSRDLVAGLTSPANYGEDFALSTDASEFEGVAPIYGLTKEMTLKRGDKIAIETGYWEYWTCIQSYEGLNDSKFELHPKHFVRGMMVGKALSCKGTWKFHCSGTWYGSYEIRKSEGEGKVSDAWSVLGESYSPIGGAANNIITGDEADECMLGLFMTRSRVEGTTPKVGFPLDTCGNALVVPPYKQDIILRQEAGGIARANMPWLFTENLTIESEDWSRSAFNEDYGYPGLVALHEGRLVLAATKHQPQTLWFSQTDDLNNFALTDEDTGALLLTMQTETQSAICWLASHSNALMVGTMDAEWTITGGNNNAFTATSATCRNYGYRGSAPVPALRAENKVLYCERGAGRVLEYGYKEEVQGYVSTDTTVFADHIARDGGGIEEGTLLRKPDYVAVFLLRDGTLALMTYNSMHNVNAWHCYSTAGHIYSVCAMPDGHNEDRLYIVVERDGAVNLEVMDQQSPYEDEGGRDYISCVETTALCTAETNDRRRLVGGFQAYFATPTPAAHVKVSMGSEYRPIAHNGRLSPGWVTLVAASNWEDLPHLGIMVRGNAACEILAAQV